MKTKLLIMTFLTLFVALDLSYSQDIQDELNQYLNTKTVIVARSYKDSIILRWGVENPAVWEIANRDGYKIEKAVLTNNEKDYNKLKFEEIEGSPFKMWNEEKYTSYFQTHDETMPESESVYLVSIMTGVFDQDKGALPKAFSTFQNDLNSLKEGKNNLDMKFGFSMLMANRSATAAIALGVRATDKKITKGKTYVYKMTLIGNSNIYKYKSCYVEVKAEEFNPDKFKEEIFYSEEDQMILLSWNSSLNFSTYNVDRSLSKTGQYQRLTKTPILKSKPDSYNGIERTGFKNDSLTNYTKYYYRIFGNTAFADSILVGEIEVMPQDRTAPQKPFLILPDNSKQNEVLLKWTMAGTIESDLKGFIVARSNKFDGTFVRINKEELNSNSREFIDKSYDRDADNFYIIQAFDTSYNFSTSNVALATIIDTTPPTRPIILSSKIDSFGVVTFKVQKNKEKDLMGYRIFKANEEEHEFSVIYEGFMDVDSVNQEVQVLFNDTVTLNSLTPYIFYKVRALDYHFNQSDFSDALKIVRPDTIPPTTPVFTNVLVREKEVELAFALSESPDVEIHILYRKTAQEAKWDSIATIDFSKKIYIDTNVKQGTIYYYSLRARDNSNLYSKYANAVYGKPYDNGVRPPIDSLTITKVEKTILLNWQYKNLNNNTFFVIYKKNGKGNLNEYKNVSETKFVDTSIKKGKNVYAIKVFTKDGGQSKLSKEVEIVIE